VKKKLKKISLLLLLQSLVGTFQVRGFDLILSVLDHALNAGYRHIGEYLKQFL
jgi:hypothetical protein